MIININIIMTIKLREDLTGKHKFSSIESFGKKHQPLTLQQLFLVSLHKHRHRSSGWENLDYAVSAHG